MSAGLVLGGLCPCCLAVEAHDSQRLISAKFKRFKIIPQEKEVKLNKNLHPFAPTKIIGVCVDYCSQSVQCLHGCVLCVCSEPVLSPAEEEAEQLMRQAAVAWNVQHNKEAAEKLQRRALEAVTAKVKKSALDLFICLFIYMPNENHLS